MGNVALTCPFLFRCGPCSADTKLCECTYMFISWIMCCAAQSWQQKKWLIKSLDKCFPRISINYNIAIQSNITDAVYTNKHTGQQKHQIAHLSEPSYFVFRQLKLTLKVLVATIDALGHLSTTEHSGRGWGKWGRRGTSRHYFPHARP